MSVKLKIKVTKEHITSKQVRRGDANSCPIALVLNNIFIYASVGVKNIYIENSFGYLTAVPLPPEASAFIEIFDKTQYCDMHTLPEIEFEISIPDIVIETINITEVNKCTACKL